MPATIQADRDLATLAAYRAHTNALCWRDYWREEMEESAIRAESPRCEQLVYTTRRYNQACEDVHDAWRHLRDMRSGR